MTLDGDVIPGWVHSLEEYQQMFDLTETDLRERSIFDFPGSISCFNAEVKDQSRRVVSGDALYDKTLEEMSKYAENRLQTESATLVKHADALLQEGESAVSSVINDWKINKQTFVDDYACGLQEQRYQKVVMPRLPYADFEFDLALCSDYVFRNQAQNDCQASDVVRELCRVAVETRIFPLFDETGKIAESLGPVLLELQQENYGIEIRQIEFKNLKGGNAMLRVWSQECRVT